MLTYWSWTSGAALPADSGLPFGPLRYRAWTSGTEGVPPAVVVIPGGGSFVQERRLTVTELQRRKLQSEDELILFIAAASASIGLLDE